MLEFLSLSSGLIFWLFVIGALLNFLPLFLDGYTMIDSTSKRYPDFIYSLSCFEMNASLVASLATTVPILADYLFDRFLRIVKYDEISTEGDSQSIYIPLRETIAFLLIPDVLILFWMIPFEQYDYMMLLLDARDTMFTYSLLLCLVKFSNPVWTKRSLLLIGVPLMTNNILLSFATLSSDPDLIQNFEFASLVILSIGLFFFLAHIVYWFWHFFHLDSKDVTTESYLCCVYSVVTSIFLLGNWLLFYCPMTFGDPWSNVGLAYLTFYTYLIASCTLCLTVISSRCARIDVLSVKVHKILLSQTFRVLTILLLNI